MDYKEDLGDFKGWNHSENHYMCYINNPAPTSRFKTLLGATTEVIATLDVPFAHRLIKMVFRQTNSSNADSGASMDIYIQRDGSIMEVPLGKDLLMVQTNLIDPINTLTFGDGYEYEPTRWQIRLYGTNTNRVHPVIYIQRLGKCRA